MKKTFDVRIKEVKPLLSPDDLKSELPLTKTASETVAGAREIVEAILGKKDKRLLIILGPCSIHDEKATLEYARRLISIREEVEESLFLVMRVYFEKPRTTVGWKGLINDPNINGTNDIETGLKKARKLLLELAELGLPTATEMLDPIIPQYTAGLITWAAIGARTTESQRHREMASGLSMPVGFKNGTDGNLDIALNAMKAARSSQTFLGVNTKGQSSIYSTWGNPWGHMVLRGGHQPNYDPVSIEKTIRRLQEEKLPNAVMVDCSHANSGKKHQGQAFVWKNIIEQRLAGNDALVGLMLESNLHEGSQKCNGDVSELKYGVSITDECISWEETRQLLIHASDRLKQRI
jgi:3-deoxy-7-phosphoheptulonate synthase